MISRGRTTRIGHLALIAALAATVAITSVGGSTPTAAEQPAATPEATSPAVIDGELTNPASRLIPINPIRVVDTRTDPFVRRLWQRSAFSIDPVTDTGVAQQAGVDADDITAVVVNMTYVNAGSVGFGTTWPTGGERPFTSTNNLDFVGHTTPNLVIAPLGMDRKISTYSSAISDVIIDVLGVFVATSASAEGRFEAVEPTRVIDTREPGVPDLEARRAVTVDLRPFGVPSDATAVVMNLTSVDARGPGFYRVWPADDSEPSHSNLNVQQAGTDTSNQVVVGVDQGRVKVASSTAAGMIIDITGYFTGPGAAVDTAGLFVPFTPGRLLDTRVSTGPTALTGGQRLRESTPTDLDVDGRLDVPDGAAIAIALNLTATEPSRRGFVKAWGTGTGEPPTSALNTSRSGQTVPNHAITSLDPADGRVRFEASMRTHLVVDATGYFLASGAPPPSGTAAVTKTVDPGSFDPSPLGAEPTAGPYDLLLDRAIALSNGDRPNPTIKVAWRVCGPNPSLRYALNIDIADNDAQIAALITAIEDVERSTGIDFVFGGVTSAGMNLDRQTLAPAAGEPYTYLPPSDVGSGVVDFVIGFSDGNDTPSLSGGVIGRGGTVFLPPRSDGRADALIGFGAIDLPDLVAASGGPDTDATMSAIRGTARHELGHLMGLGHVDSLLPPLGGSFSTAEIARQLMFPSIRLGFGAPELDFATGDDYGMWQLYATQPACSTSKSDASARSDIDLTNAIILADH